MKKEVVDRFLLKIDELNDISTQILAVDTPQQASSMFEDLLISAYIEGIAGANYLLGGGASVGEENLRDAIDWKYKGVSIQQRLIAHYEKGSLPDIKNLVESEFHRVYTMAQLDAAKEIGKSKKTWVDAGDDKVRDTHAYLNGITIDIDDEFITFDGDSAKVPGGFTLAQNNANCRCILDFSD